MKAGLGIAWLAAALGLSACATGGEATPDVSDSGDRTDVRPDDAGTDDGTGFDEWDDDGSPADDAIPPDDAGEADVPSCPPEREGLECSDGNGCTLEDRCVEGVCTGTAKDCNDGNLCTDDSCIPETGACLRAPNAIDCDDSNPCTVGDRCADRACAPGPATDCTSFDDPCHQGRCSTVSGECYAAFRGFAVSCVGDDPCVVGQTCDALEECSGGSPRNCTTLTDACNIGACDSATGDCYKDPRDDGYGCNDGVTCTTPDGCIDGTCVGGRTDADHDGYYLAGCLDGNDCLDSNRYVHPGATEGPVGTATCFDTWDNDCDAAADLLDTVCSTGLDWTVLEGPLTVVGRLATATEYIYGRAYEPGTGSAGTPAAAVMTGLWAQLGYGPLATDPTGNPAWTWIRADYYGQGGTSNLDDRFRVRITPTVGGTFSTAYRFSIDGGATWSVYADSDGNGAASPSNGLQIANLGRLTVLVNDHVLISEVVVHPAGYEFVEVRNAGSASAAIAGYHLYDATHTTSPWHYWDLPAGSASYVAGAGEFVAHFPAATSLAPDARAVVALSDAQSFRAAWGRSPDYEMCPNLTGAGDDPTVPNMVAAFTDSIQCSASSGGQLHNSIETLVLFSWDGSSDLVDDVDIVQWKDTATSLPSEAIDKTGVTRDGPDGDAVASAYLADTPVASQSYITFSLLPPTGGSFSRTDDAETGETHSGGNGLTNHNETSEPFGTTWTLATTATPGS